VREACEKPHRLCLPSAASRILGSVTTLSSNVPAVRPLLPDLFYRLGVLLLTNKLTEDDISTSMFAYAKSSFVTDVGVFDHLAERLAANLESCSTRQISKGLWSCARMTLLEGIYGQDAPYLSHVEQYFNAIVSRSSELSPQDLTRTIWSAGRLLIDSEAAVNELAHQALERMDEFNSQEVANILWGLSRLHYDDKDTTLALATRMTHPDMRPQAQEAASVLYAITYMRVRDAELFSALVDILMSQINTASAQAIANTLWAFRTARYETPQRLLDQWALSMKINVADASLQEN